MNAAVKLIHSLREKPPHWGWVEGLYLGGDDDGVALRLLHGHDYEPESRKLWRFLCKRSELAIDIGAHTGIYTLDALNSGINQVVSLEPYYFNFARLVMNIRHSGFEANDCLMCAASDEDGMVSFKVPPFNFYCSAGGKIPKEGEQGMMIRVTRRRLDTLIPVEFHSKIGVVKIDTEGHCLKTLMGMAKILSHKPDLIIECIEEGMGEFLRPLGYKFYVINEKTGLQEVDDLQPDNPVNMGSPNRFATVKYGKAQIQSG